MNATDRLGPRMLVVLLLGCCVALSAGGCQRGTPSRGGGGCVDPADCDADGLTDAEEALLGTDPALADSDGDGLDDGREVALGTSPLARDSDGDGLEDGVDPQPAVSAEEPTGDNDNQAPEEADGDNDNESDNDNGELPPVESANENAEPQVQRIEEAERNDTFGEATAAGLGELGALTLVGSIGGNGDVDIFDLGALEAGDRLTVTTVEAGGSFDLVAAAFCEAQDIVSHTDHLETVEVVGDVLLGEVARHPSPHYYLALTHDDVLATAGDYEVEVSVERGGEAPQPAGQVVLLDFRGGSVSDLLDEDIELASFDAADLAPELEDYTGAIKSAIIQTIRADFDGFDLTLLESDTDALPADGVFSRIYFGGFSPSEFSISDGFDPYNRNSSDRAVIYTGSFAPDAFDTQVEPTDIGRAIGTRASYELGQLLGLKPVDGPGAIMVDVQDADLLLEERSFTTAPLAQETFPVGQQDAALLLTEIIGAAP